MIKVVDTLSDVECCCSFVDIHTVCVCMCVCVYVCLSNGDCSPNAKCLSVQSCAQGVCYGWYKPDGHNLGNIIDWKNVLLHC